MKWVLVCYRESAVLTCVSKVKPGVNYFRDVDAAVSAFLSKQSFVPPILLKYCKQ